MKLPAWLGELRLFARLWPHARPDIGVFLLSLMLTPLVAAVGLAQPYLLKRAIDEHIVPGRVEGLETLAFWYLGAVLAAWFMEGVYTLAISWAGTRTIVRLRTALYATALRLSQSFFDTQPAGALLTRLTSDVESLGEAIRAGVVTIALDLLIIGGALATMFWLDPRLTLVVLGLAPPLLLVLELLRRRLRRLYLEVRDALATVNSWLAERIDGVQIVQLFGAEGPSADEFERRIRRFRTATTRSNVYDAAMFAVVDGTSSVFVAAMLAYGAGLFAPLFSGIGLSVGEAVTVGLLVAFIEYLDRLFRPLRDLSNKVAVIQRALAALNRIFGLFDQGVPITPGPTRMGELVGRIEMRDVRFRYRPDGPEILHGVDLSVAPGEVVAVVGSSGSGKTTLTRLLDRSYEGYTGSIKVDGVELSTVALPDLRRQVAAVRQDIQVFTESLRFNVALDNPAIPAAQTDLAARLVHADRFVDTGPPSPVDTPRLSWAHVLRERGADLSVGEGQLLTFARTMAHEPTVVILDEATASIDSLTEALVQDAIAQILARKTVIVVAHRLSTIQNADRIVVMHGGEVVETGSHDQLMAADGRYAELVEAGRSAGHGAPAE